MDSHPPSFPPLGHASDMTMPTNRDHIYHAEPHQLGQRRRRRHPASSHIMLAASATAALFSFQCAPWTSPSSVPYTRLPFVASAAALPASIDSQTPGPVAPSFLRRLNVKGGSKGPADVLGTRGRQAGGGEGGREGGPGGGREESAQEKATKTPCLPRRVRGGMTRLTLAGMGREDVEEATDREDVRGAEVQATGKETHSTDAPASTSGDEERRLEGDGWVEPICREDPARFVLFPIRHPELWEMYKRHEASFWTAEEVDLSQDMEDWRVGREG
ncbi:ribonucleotide reductase small subunit, partial [Nannochloropsis gaditana]